MRILSNIVIADEADIEAIGQAGRPVDEWRGIEVQGIGPAKIAMLDAVLTGEGFDEALIKHEPLYSASEMGPWVIRLAESAVEKLAALDEDVLGPISEELCASEEFEADGWPLDQVQTLLEEMSTLANVALAQGREIFVWVSQ